jgi:hypothetical protein
VIFDGVEDAAISNFSVQGDADAESTLRFTRTRKVYLTALRLLNAAACFLQLEGTTNEGITIDGGDLSAATKTVAFKDGATPAAVRLRA